MSSPTPTASVTVRRARPEDAETCGRICYEAFATINRAHNFPADFPSPVAGIGLLSMLFSHPAFYCVVADVEGRTVGSNCLDERSLVAGLGPITVDPGVQNRGVGRLLMLALMERARERGFAGVRLLQAAFHNRSLSLYSKLGFDAKEPMSVMHGLPLRVPLAGCDVRPATLEDLDEASRICERVHGLSRAGELRESVSQGSALVVSRHGRITGYAAGFGYFGHAVGESNVDVKALIGAAENVSGPGVIIPTRNADLFRWCLSQGMRVLHPMTLMSTGLYSEPAGAYLPSVLY
jgi:GNAT superfamily N-acetyltransferase